MRLRSTLPILIAGLLLVICTADAAAMYNPRMGRFMQRDPRGTALDSSRVQLTRGGSQNVDFIQRDPKLQYADGMNLYQYVASNPLKHTDLTGLHISRFDNCSAAQKKDLRAAEQAVRNRLPTVIRDMKRQTPAWVITNWVIPNGRGVGGPRNMHVYGNYRTEMNVVFSSMLSDANSGITVECDCECDQRTIAYVPVIKFTGIPYGDIHFCPAYFSKSARQQTTRFMHELSHWSAWTDDRGLAWVAPGNVGNAPDDAYWIERFMYQDVRTLNENNIWSKVWP